MSEHESKLVESQGLRSPKPACSARRSQQLGVGGSEGSGCKGGYARVSAGLANAAADGPLLCSTLSRMGPGSRVVGGGSAGKRYPTEAHSPESHLQTPARSPGTGLLRSQRWPMLLLAIPPGVDAEWRLPVCTEYLG